VISRYKKKKETRNQKTLKLFAIESRSSIDNDIAKTEKVFCTHGEFFVPETSASPWNTKLVPYWESWIHIRPWRRRKH